MIESADLPEMSSYPVVTDLFDDAAERAMQALRDAVAERRRRGLLLTVDRGHGVEHVA